MLRTLRRLTSLVLCALVLVAANAAAQWTYGAPIDITNNGPALADYQVAVTLNTAALVSAGKMQADGDDIRFTDGSCAQLSYWIESGINTTETKIWVKVPALAANGVTRIFLQYGDATAIAASDAAATFIFFDGFDGASLDLTKWESSGSVSVVGGSATLTGSSTLRSTGSYTGPITIDAMITAASGSFPIVGQLNDGSDVGFGLGYDGASIISGVQTYMTHGSSGSLSLGNPTPSGSVVGVWSFTWIESARQKGSWPGGSIQTSWGGSTLGSVDLMLRTWNFTSPSLSADWARIRAYAATEPTVSIGDEGPATTTATVSVNPTSNAIACAGGSVSFTANAVGYTTVQWQSSTDGGTTWNNIPGATSTTYTIDPTTLAMNGHQFRAHFDPSVCNGPKTAAATLTLHPAPSLTVSLTPSVIAYKSSGKMRSIYATVTPNGACGPFTTQLVSITANEPIGADDVKFASYGTSPADLAFNVSSNRISPESPRVYTVTYRVTDASGNSTDVSSTVTVPVVGGM